MATRDDQTMRRIVFLDRETLPAEIILKSFAFPNDLTVYQRTLPGEVADRIADADIVITNKVLVSAHALQCAPRVKLMVAATDRHHRCRGLPEARNCRLQYPQLRDQHGAGTHVRAHPGNATERISLS